MFRYSSKSTCGQTLSCPSSLELKNIPFSFPSSSLSGGRHSSIAFITEGPNPKNKSLKRLDLSDLTIVSLEARSTQQVSYLQKRWLRQRSDGLLLCLLGVLSVQSGLLFCVHSRSYSQIRDFFASLNQMTILKSILSPTPKLIWLNKGLGDQQLVQQEQFDLIGLLIQLV